jgi:phosphatidylinositol glycan class O
MAAKVVHSRNLRDSFYIAVFLAGLYWFAASFFLAKKSLSHISSCHEPEALLVDVLGLSAEQVKALQDHHVLSQSSQTHRKGCWMSRRVDSVVLLLVDALRFDFCLYNLPDSVGTRLSQKDNATRLFRFVADPPTVTMQRLKALTTGGLPTFADISANFGGASLEDDSWMHQLLRHTKTRLYQSSLATTHIGSLCGGRYMARFVSKLVYRELSLSKFQYSRFEHGRQWMFKTLA